MSRMRALLGHQHELADSDLGYAVRLAEALLVVDAHRTEPELQARLAHLALTLAIDDLSWWPGDTAPAPVRPTLGALQLLHQRVAGALPVDELARWLGRNYASADHQLHLPVGPYLPVLGEAGIDELTAEVRLIDRFTGSEDHFSISRMLAREIALHTGDVDRIVAEFGGGLRAAEDFLGVSRAFQIAGLPLQAEAFARRGARLGGPSGLACRMIVLEFQLDRDPETALDEARSTLAAHPTREVAGVIRRALAAHPVDLHDEFADVIADLDPPTHIDCLLGFALPVRALDVAARNLAVVDVPVLCQTIDQLAEFDHGPHFVEQATRLLRHRSDWNDDERLTDLVSRSIAFAQSVYPELPPLSALI